MRRRCSERIASSRVERQFTVCRGRLNSSGADRGSPRSAMRDSRWTWSWTRPPPTCKSPQTVLRPFSLGHRRTPEAEAEGEGAHREQGIYRCGRAGAGVGGHGGSACADPRRAEGRAEAAWIGRPLDGVVSAAAWAWPMQSAGVGMGACGERGIERWRTPHGYVASRHLPAPARTLLLADDRRRRVLSSRTAGLGPVWARSGDL